MQKYKPNAKNKDTRTVNGQMNQKTALKVRTGKELKER